MNEPAKIPDEVFALIERVNTNAPSKKDIEAFKRAIKAQPDLLGGFSDLAIQAQQHIARSTQGTVLVKEAVASSINQVCLDLGYSKAAPLERLLIDNIALNHARLYLLEQHFTNVMQGNMSASAAMYWERKLSMTQARYVRAIEALARVRRLLKPKAPPVQVNIGDKQVNVAQGVQMGK